MRLVIIFILLFLSACSPTPSPTPSITPTFTLTLPPTATITRTPPPTWTHVPTLTFTPTLTPTLIPTITPSETPAPLAPAQLFTFRDADGRLIDWSYAHISSYTTNEHGAAKTLTAYLAFQLMDRAIHHETVMYDSQTLTIYYLNVQHDFSGSLLPVKLILSAASGADVPLSLIPGGGGAYLRLRMLPLWDGFDAFAFHRDANKPYADRSRRYPDVLLADLEKLLPALPSSLIVLADAQVLFDPDTLAYTVKYNLDTVPYLAARYMPFLAVDDYDRATGPNPEATSLANHLIHLDPFPNGIPYYSSDTLVLIPLTAQLPTLP
jgi:hypothetical protein